MWLLYRKCWRPLPRCIGVSFKMKRTVVQKHMPSVTAVSGNARISAMMECEWDLKFKSNFLKKNLFIYFFSGKKSLH